ncbi:MAG TPA: hypothetical protein VE981_18285 [Planctomycetota bacterium]|nr:hypothetical protein [Planctomycetota bacterium]
MKASSALGIAGLTIRSLVGGKRIWAAAFLVLAPPLFAGIAAVFGKHVEPINLFHGFIFEFSLWFVVYLLALIYGIALTMGEIEDGTAGYLYLSAVPKWLIVLIQLAVTAVALTVSLFVNVALTGLAASLGKGTIPHLWRDVFSCTLVGSAGILVSLGYYVTCGLVFRSPTSALAGALIPTFFWEILMTNWPIRFAGFTVTNNLRGMLLPLVFEGKRGALYRYVRNFHLPDYGEAAMYLSILSGIFLVTAMIAAMNRSIEGKEAR